MLIITSSHPALKGLRLSDAEFARTRPVRKCVAGFMRSQFNHHVPTLNLHRIHRYLRARRAGLARLWVPRPAVPWADYLAALDHAFAQGTTAVQTGVLHGEDFAVHVGNADWLVAAGEFFGLVEGGKVGLSGEFGEHSEAAFSFQLSAVS